MVVLRRWVEVSEGPEREKEGEGGKSMISWGEGRGMESVRDGGKAGGGVELRAAEEKRAG